MKDEYQNAHSHLHHSKFKIQKNTPATHLRTSVHSSAGAVQSVGKQLPSKKTQNRNASYPGRYILTGIVFQTSFQGVGGAIPLL
jgi:hypothetical protein